ncbi:hypothetical protein [Ideonella sp. YS5]|uniref:hypothetical protein n=1 Tax=Ideonella sp. YS5 TaxID=3453714 RepID=UPI003EEBCD86
MNTSWNTRLAAAAASAATTLALLHGLLCLAGPAGAGPDPLSARLNSGRCAAGIALATLEHGSS